MQSPRPFLTAALFCERVLEEKDGSLTVVRIVDKVTIETEGIPEGLKPMIQITLLVGVKSGDFTGDFTLTLRGRRPNGESKMLSTPFPAFNFLGGDHGQNYILNVSLGVEEEGLHWFDVIGNGDVLTSVPLTIVRKQKPLEKTGQSGTVETPAD